MVEIKIDTEEIIFRIYLAGSEAAANFATIRGIHDVLPADESGDLTVLHAGGDRVVGFRYHAPSVDPLFGMQVSLHALTLPGPLASPANETLLLRAADAVIYVDEREPGDPTASVRAFQSHLDKLDALGRQPDELPVSVVCFEDGLDDREKIFESSGRRWSPTICRSRSDSSDLSAIFDDARARILENYRRYENELATRGLHDHIKIRNRIYEKVTLTLPSDLGSEPGVEAREREVRLVESHPAGSFASTARPALVVFAAIILVAIAAVALSFAF